MTNKQNELPEMHQRALSVLPEGRTEAIPFEEVLRRVGLPNRETDKRRLRSVLSELVTRYKQPVGCSSVGDNKGFYTIATLDDFLYADRTLVSREVHLRKRRAALTEACKGVLRGGQAELDFVEDEDEVI